MHGHANVIKELIMVNPLLDRVNGRAITRVAQSRLELDWYRVVKGLVHEYIKVQPI